MPGVVVRQLRHTEPLAFGALLDFLALRAVPGIEAVVDGRYRRTLRLPHGAGVVEVGPADAGSLRARFQLADDRDLDAAVALIGHLLDLDAEAAAIDAALGRDPALRESVRLSPGRRVPHAVDGCELAVRAVLGQQVSVKGARTLAGRLVARVGTPLARADGTLTHVFPSAAAVADANLDGLGLTGARIRTIRALGAAMAAGGLRLDAGGDTEAITAQLVALPGIGPWTASYVAMRALGDPDAFLPTDLGVRRALERRGEPSDPQSADARAERWRPWRAYAVMHLWASE